MNMQLIKGKTINKIMVVGHPLSDYQKVETLLNTCGMHPAEPSHRDGYLPAEISATLCKAHRVAPLGIHHAGDNIKQIEVGAIWNGMALDLLLGNIDQELWGWADPQAVYLLDYWKGLDPDIAFILVYDTPEQLVARAFDENTPLSPEALQHVIHNWSEYNAALLHFYHRNPERCLLVHAQQVSASAGTYLQQVRTYIGAPVLLDPPDSIADEANDIALHETAAPQQDALKVYLARTLIQQQPDIMQLYEELQSVANLPLSEHVAAPYSPMDAWISMAALQTHQTEQFTHANARAQVQIAQIQTLGQKLSNAQELAGEAQQHITRLDETQAIALKHTKDQQEESALILLQLHQVQEELERHHLEGQQQKEKIKVLLEAKKGAIEREINSDKLRQDETKQVSERASQLELTLKAKAETDKALVNAQAELSKVQVSAKAQGERLTQDNVRLQSERDAQVKLVQTQAVQIKEAAAKFSLVTPELKQENDLLLLQLHQVQEELERHYLESQKLKTLSLSPANPKKPLLYGAVERVKGQLPYRLGATMIAQSRSFSGCVTLPWTLLRQVREFRQEEKIRGNTPLPPINNYIDADEAERVKQHLSYKLGTAMVANGRNPLGWLKMPWALRREALNFKHNRNTK
jgi:hypothetical protein